ncbi:transposase [Rhodococcus sp. 1.20]
MIRRLAEQLNVHPEALRSWIRQAQADHGERDDRPSTAMLEENRRLARQNAELRRVNEVCGRRARISLRRSTRPGGHEFR